MGLDTPTFLFLFGAKAAGVDFSSLGTLGRQQFFPSRKPLAEALRLHKISRAANELIISSGAYSDEVFRLLGARTIDAIDASGFEQASIIHDMNQPVPPELKGRFSVLFDGGSLEHVFHVPQAMRSCMEMVRVGGHFIGSSPANNYMGHGFYQFSPELLYRVFSPANGFSETTVLLGENTRKPRWYQAIDPMVAGKRFELTGGPPLSMLTIARKTAATPPFSPWPQQSDYSSLWQKKVRGDTFQKAHRRFGLLKSLLPEYVKNLLRPQLYARNHLHQRPECFIPMSQEDVILGRWQ
jgi:hypothetical protein